ncbi:MAG: low-specificity L-threonine aldolase [Actinomycetota bacterium]|nr:low-specificity L-threonine aldolase [Actinomycetota bacterium]
MIDLRSDTVTRPTYAMRAAMASASVGDDVFADDPTVNELQRRAAELLGFEAAMFATSGTQANLCALLSHCQRGDEYLVGQSAHTYRYEAGGAAVLGGIVPQPVESRPDGTFDLDLLFGYIKPNDSHFAQTRLLTLENTKDGMPLPPEYVADAQARARDAGLRLHLDGARLWNAAVAGAVEPARIAAGFDSVSVCLSKGLGAPAGSLLVGSSAFIQEARRWRKMLGGGMRQTGILAAAGLLALEHHRHRLADDHANATRLAEGLARIAPLEVAGCNTNMVFVKLNTDPATFGRALAAEDVAVLANPVTRFVTHLDVTADDIDHVVAVVSAVLGDDPDGPRVA